MNIKPLASPHPRSIVPDRFVVVKDLEDKTWHVTSSRCLALVHKVWELLGDGLERGTG